MADDSLSSSGKKRSSRRLLDPMASEQPSAASPTTDLKASRSKDKEKLVDKPKKDAPKTSSANLPRPDASNSTLDKPNRPVRAAASPTTLSPESASLTLSVPKSSNNAPERSEPEVRMEDLPSLEGVLNKWSGTFKGWKKRVFILRGGTLFYFVHNKQKANIPMEDAVVVVSKKARRFEIDTGNVVLHLQTKTPEERAKWIKAFEITQKMLKQYAAQQAAHDTADAASDARRQQVVKAKSESLQQTLTLAKSIHQVLMSQIDILRSESRSTSMSSANLEATSSGSGDLSVSGESDHDKKKKHGHRRARSTQVADPLAEFGGASAPSASSLPTANHFVSQADDFRKTAARFLDVADTLAQEIAEANNALEKELEAERERSSKLKERVKDLRSKNGSLRKELKTFSENASRAGDDIGDVGDDKIMFADVVTATDASSDSDSDEYFDPLEFSTMDDSDDGDKFVSDSDSDDSDSDSQFFDAEQPKSAAAHKSSSGKSPAPPQPTSLPSPKLKNRSQNEIQRRASLVGMSLTRRQSIPATAPAPTSSGNFDETLACVPAGFKHRESLPADKNFKVKVSLMKILKDSIGKDLSRITIPVQFAEPTNLLQRLVEDMQYINVLESAIKCKDSLKRLAHIAAFAAGGYAATINRLGKPFNPILGETYEWVNRDVGFRLVSEQVSHHPQVSALHAEGRDWVIWTTIFTKNKFWGKSLEIFPTGTVNLAFPTHGDHFMWQKVTTCVNNVLVGTKWVDHYGEMTIVNSNTDEKCLLEFKRGGFWGGNSFEVNGAIYDKENKLRWRVTGKWSESISAFPVDPNGNQIGEASELWRRVMPPEHSERQYYFPTFAMQLNELPAWMKPYLPPTDTRLRPDQSAMELGDVDRANEEKTRLEEKQRAARKALEAKGQEWEPKWFKKDEQGRPMKSSHPEDLDLHAVPGSRFLSPGWRHSNSAFVGTIVGLLVEGFPILKLDANITEILSSCLEPSSRRSLTNILAPLPTWQLLGCAGKFPLAPECIKEPSNNFQLINVSISTWENPRIFILEIEARRKVDLKMVEAELVASAHDWWCIFQCESTNIDSYNILRMGNQDKVDPGVGAPSSMDSWASSSSNSWKLIYVAIKEILGFDLTPQEQHLSRSFIARGRDLLCITMREELYKISANLFDDIYLFIRLEMVSERPDRTADPIVKRCPKGFCCWELTSNDPTEIIDAKSTPFRLIQANSIGRNYFKYPDPVGVSAAILMPYVVENPTLFGHFLRALREQINIVLEENQTNAGANSIADLSDAFYNITIRPISKYVLVCCWRDITDNIRNRDICQRMHAVLDAAPIMCFMTSQSLTISYMNRYGKNLIGCLCDSKFRIQSLSIGDLLPEILDLVVSQPVGSADYKTVLSKIDGSRSSVFVKITRFCRSMEEEHEGSRMAAVEYVGFVQETTGGSSSADFEAENVLREARIAAKNDLLATVSHEMRTPLNGIVGNADLLSLSVTDPWQVGVVRNISTCSKILLQIINDILDFAKVDSSKMELDQAPFHVSDCVDAAIGVVSAALRSKKQNLIFHICPHSAKEVIGDSTRTKQLVLNILNNASKFTPLGGTLELGLCVQESGHHRGLQCTKSLAFDACVFDELQGGSFRRIFSGSNSGNKTHQCRVFVRDSGRGMTPQQLGSIFTPFTQIRGLGSSKGHGLHDPETGTGLGLSIVRKLLELMGGSCSVRSVEGKGSCFSLSFPCNVSDTLSKSGEEIRRMQSVSAALVSSDSSQREAMASLLAYFGVQVTKAEHLEDVAIEKFDICFLDVAKDVDLKIYLQQMRKNILVSPESKMEPLSRRIVLLIPPRASESVEQQAIELGSSNCLFCPITVASLQDVIKDVIRGGASTVADGRKTPLSSSAESDDVESPMKMLVVEDNVTNRFVLVQMLMRIGIAASDIVQAENGQEALDQMKKSPFDIIFMDIHMPIMSGWEAARLIRAAPQDYEPFGLLLALTAAATLKEREESMKYMDVFISKPLQLTKLIDTLNQCCKKLKIRKTFEMPVEQAKKRRSADTSLETNGSALNTEPDCKIRRSSVSFPTFLRRGAREYLLPICTVIAVFSAFGILIFLPFACRQLWSPPTSAV